MGNQRLTTCLEKNDTDPQKHSTTWFIQRSGPMRWFTPHLSAAELSPGLLRPGLGRPCRCRFVLGCEGGHKWMLRLRLGFVWCFGFIGFRIWFSCAVSVAFFCCFSWHFFFLILFLLHGRPPETKHNYASVGCCRPASCWSTLKLGWHQRGSASCSDLTGPHGGRCKLS